MENNISPNIQRLAINAIIASIYYILTMVTAPVSYMGIQIRIAEILVLLCFFRKDYVIGVTLGCLLANLFSPLGYWDMLFGTLATLLSGLLIGYMKHLFIAALIPVVINGFVVGAELYFLLQEPFWLNAGLVAIGEFIAVAILGYFIFLFLGKKEKFQEVISANQNYRFKW
ncbi:MAG: QueT transporter family protein [Bacilli bacterium]|jgi:uncharacterized membrane protein